MTTPTHTLMGKRVRLARQFRHWQQRPGEVVDVDPALGVVKIRWEHNSKEAWVHASIVEVMLEAQPTSTVPRLLLPRR